MTTLPDYPLLGCGLLWWAVIFLLGSQKLRSVCRSTPHHGNPWSTSTTESDSIPLHYGADCQHSVEARETLLFSKISVLSRWQSRKTEETTSSITICGGFFNEVLGWRKRHSYSLTSRWGAKSQRLCWMLCPLAHFQYLNEDILHRFIHSWDAPSCPKIVALVIAEKGGTAVLGSKESGTKCRPLHPKIPTNMSKAFKCIFSI